MPELWPLFEVVGRIEPGVDIYGSRPVAPLNGRDGGRFRLARSWAFPRALARGTVGSRGVSSRG